MDLKDLLAEMGYHKGVALRYNDHTDLVVFFFHLDGHNPAVTRSGSLVSVGTMPVKVRGVLGDTRVRNPLYGRSDFDLSVPESLAGIDECLQRMIDRCDRR